MPKEIPRLIVASSESSADLRYAIQFSVGDPVIFLEQDGKKTLVLNDLEIDRGKKQAQVDEIIALSDVNDRIRKDNAEPHFHQSVVGLLRSRRIKKARVPADFPLGLAQNLIAEGITLIPQPGLFFPEREFKSPPELKLVRRALSITETGMSRGIEVLRASDIGKGNVLRWSGRPLTSEILRAEIDCAILREGGLPANTIVAGGNQACDPHERGHGPLRGNSLIILDVFPRDASSGYFGDLTRTVVRGKASDAQRQLWNTVLEGQKIAFAKMRPGAVGESVHEEVKSHFTKTGFPTEQSNGRWGGFFHGTGHGLGLEIHESPRFSRTVFKPGQVMTVEPGLYYYGLGGVRHEDVVTITDKGIKILSTLPKPLEL